MNNNKENAEMPGMCSVTMHGYRASLGGAMAKRHVHAQNGAF